MRSSRLANPHNDVALLEQSLKSLGLKLPSSGAGMLIAYATAEGELASDVGAGAGPYARVLAEEIVKPGVEAVYMFRRVQVRVRSTIGQEPWLGFSALGEVHLAGVQAEASKPTATSPPMTSEAEREWDRTKDGANIAVLELFAASYKDTYYAGLARLRIEELKRKQVAVAEPPKPPPPTAGRCDGVEVLVGDQKRCLKPGAGKSEQFKDCPTAPKWWWCRLAVTMGSPANEPQRSDSEAQVHATIARPFAVGRYAVTRGECGAFVRTADTRPLAATHGTAHLEATSGQIVALGWLWQNDRHPVSASIGTTRRLMRRGCRERPARPTACCRRPSGSM